ncbi:hypothetical protein GIB67_042572 [Kingdonia uniflora]|uniref:No apical meristem-associated C-terminal domain-containing protein n=1 Tax=Kingdonia uniflora TaxID=39325 RepID=A0A7J7M175_9MAGN|nr:hypothetical protein GIB67_042572 [Kingdonia uniflora]
MGIQNKNLAKAWVHVSEDRIKNNNQQLDVFWESVLDAFHEFCQEDGERVERTVSYLKNYWSDMNHACKIYETCLKSVMQGPISGMQQGNLDDAAKTMYEVRGKGKWLYKDAYKVLSVHQCWKILQNQHPETLARNVRMKQTSNSSPGTSTPTTPDTPVSSNNDSPVLVTDEETERPGGIQSAKQKKMNKKRQNLLIECQNVLISRLDRMEKKKEKYVAERDKKKEERDARIIKLRERKINVVVNLEAQFQAQNDQKVMAMDMSTLENTQRIYWEAQRNAIMTRLFQANNNI